MEPSRKIIYVTGATASYFPMVCGLLASLRAFDPGIKLHVCDLGLTREQAAFLNRLGLLLPKPDHLESGRHAYYYKGSLAHYVAHLNFDALVWIDSDCVVAKPLSGEVVKILQGVGVDEPFLATTSDINGLSIGGFIKQNAGITAPFQEGIKKGGINPNYPYLNSGVFILHAPKALQAWAELVGEIPEHLLFEQNAYNLAVYQHVKRIGQLDWTTWSVCGSLLNQLTLQKGADDLPFHIYLGDQRVFVVHIASTREQAALDFDPIALPVADRYVVGLYRYLRNETIQKTYLEQLYRYLAIDPENRRHLLETGAALDKNPMDPNLSDQERKRLEEELAIYFKYG
ncbi:MAG: hypothetical protein HQL52_06200 [Magnetococcales bacterium]|nr:hypothetical protein [Magnetococcales bacterium]